jgi:hypothetical protein
MRSATCHTEEEKQMKQRTSTAIRSANARLPSGWKWIILLALTDFSAALAFARFEIVADTRPQSVFGGKARTVTVVWQNSGDRAVEFDVRARLFQIASGTAVQISDVAWKKLQALPGQTITEMATLDFPDVKGESRFLIQWMQSTNQIFGQTDVLVYPTNLLAELRSLTRDEDALGVFDPQDELKPLLRNVQVQFLDLGNQALDAFRGKLAIIGPFEGKTQMHEDLASQIRKIARKGVAVVWLQPQAEKRSKLQPSFYSVPEGEGTVVVVQPDLVADLAENPQSQLNLIQFCKFAMHPQPPTLPYLSPGL